MLPLDIIAIEQQARQLRAREMQRIQGLFVKRLRQYGRLLGASIRAAAGSLRPLFSWNPVPGSIRMPVKGRSEVSA